MSAQIRWFRLTVFATVFTAGWMFTCRAEEPVSKLNYEAVPGFFQLPASEHFVEVAGVAVNSKGHIYVFHRGKHPLMEFDANGKFLRSIADDLFVTAHTVRVDAEDNIWTTDVGAHMVLKLSPDGRVLLSLGRSGQRATTFCTLISRPTWLLTAKEISTSLTVKVTPGC